jgi:ATP-dependent helicase/nuclease subunit B
MPVSIYLAPAGAGKTAFVLHLVREAARDLECLPRVVVPSGLQVRAWRRRLAEAGGAIGVRVFTFAQLYADCLIAAGEAYTEVGEAVQYRLIRQIVDDLHLAHYAPIIDRPGFFQILVEMIAELKAARVRPKQLSAAVAALGDEPRLAELARIYSAYQERLQERQWADGAGLGWLAVEALDQRAPHVARDWPLLVVDGFDNFTPVQMDFLAVLADRVKDTIITLTGTVDGSERPLVHRRFERTRWLVGERLGLTATPLPEPVSRQAPALAHLEANLYRSDAQKIDAQGALELMEAPDRAAEVRAALRWLKARLVEEGMRPGDVALLARSIAPYRPFIQQTVEEFGIPVQLVDGLPLGGNPAIAALLDLLRLMLPRSETESEPALPRRLVLEAWRSPYFDWFASPEEGEESIGISLQDADTLDVAARWGRVIGGLSQWEEVLGELAAQGEEVSPDDEERGRPAEVPVGAAAQVLEEKFERFVERLRPPEGERSYREFAGWLEDLVGGDPELGSARFPAEEEPTSLQIVRRAREASEALADRDVAALRALKDILRGLVWAEDALGVSTLNFAAFFAELVGAVDAAVYRLPFHPDREEVLVADVLQARGLPFRAVAVLGLAEGEFPATLSEDPFLRDADRGNLREGFGLALEPSTESAEAEYFYETVSRPRERLLLTRPRLADNGALWQASPFWEEARRLVNVEPKTLTSETLPPPSEVASWPELMESLSAHGGDEGVRQWVSEREPQRIVALDEASDVLHLRSTTFGEDDLPGPHDGELASLGGDFARRFSPAHVWSASRLESYVTCGFFFFVGSVLGLEAREEPTEGLDSRQLGNIYHRILHGVYGDAMVTDTTSLEQLLEVLPRVAERVLDEAPRREAFRETAWWQETRKELVDHVRRSLEALAEADGQWVPSLFEVPFGFEGQPPLVVEIEGDSLRLHGVIDRVDVNLEGGLRIIDYKTGGKWAFTKAAVAQGKKLQLPLYALGARDALSLGEPVEGFYWHVQQAERSGFTLSRFDGGPRGAIKVAVDKAWEAVRGARSGHFVPRPPQAGCPSYCPAAAFCWRYSPGYGG